MNLAWTGPSRTYLSFIHSLNFNGIWLDARPGNAWCTNIYWLAYESLITKLDWSVFINLFVVWTFSYYMSMCYKAFPHQNRISYWAQTVIRSHEKKFDRNLKIIGSTLLPLSLGAKFLAMITVSQVSCRINSTQSTGMRICFIGCTT